MVTEKEWARGAKRKRCNKTTKCSRGKLGLKLCSRKERLAWAVQILRHFFFFFLPQGAITSSFSSIKLPGVAALHPQHVQFNQPRAWETKETLRSLKTEETLSCKEELSTQQSPPPAVILNATHTHTHTRHTIRHAETRVRKYMFAWSLTRTWSHR